MAAVTQLRRWLVWLSRIHHCRGFGIQSPTDYAFVRYVVNEHWPYYAYDTLTGDDWMTRKLGRLYLRLANWRQPAVMQPDRYQRYWQAGCRTTRFLNGSGKVELARIDLSGQASWEPLLAHCDEHSVLVVEGIWRYPAQWADIKADPRVGTTFDLYYCAIVFFDTKRFRHHYTINF